MARFLRRPLTIIALLILIFTAPLIAVADDLSVAAASDLQFVFPELARQFEAKTGNKVKVSFGSSGNFATQIKNGAPFDLFFSADITYPKDLELAGLIEPGTLYKYARGKIVLWAQRDSRIDLSKGLSVLLDPAIHKIAIANPQHAPYGRAAVAAMQHENIYDKVKEKLVVGENVSQTAQFVQSGNADVGIIALSLSLGEAMRSAGKYQVIPITDYPAIEQACAILKTSQHKQAAREFLTFIKSKAVANLLSTAGFTAPAEQKNTVR